MKKAKKKHYKLKGKIWLYPGDAPWHFLSIEKKEAIEIKEAHGAHAKGFGSLPVEVTVGKTVWRTSIFPDKKSNTYLLPLKASVRKAEGVYDGDTVSFAITIRP